MGVRENPEKGNRSKPLLEAAGLAWSCQSQRSLHHGVERTGVLQKGLALEVKS